MEKPPGFVQAVLFCCFMVYDSENAELEFCLKCATFVAFYLR